MVKRSILSGSIGSRLTGGGFGGFVVSLVNINKHKKWKTRGNMKNVMCVSRKERGGNGETDRID